MLCSDSVPACDVDLESFLSDQDPVWDRLPLRWEEGPFVGNGLVGSVVVGKPDDNRVSFWVSRSDVGRLDYPGCGDTPNRDQIGTFDLCFGANLIPERCTARIDLYNAEARGVFVTETGKTQWRLYAPSGGNTAVLDLAGEGQWRWEPQFHLNEKYFPHQGTFAEREGVQVFEVADFVPHERTDTASGGFAVAWAEDERPDGARRFLFSVGVTPVNRAQWTEQDQGKSARDEALDGLTVARSEPAGEQIERHRKWWHRTYQRSFFSISDTELESYYWIQLYKLASTARPDRPMLDNHGVWSVAPSYGFSTWDYNVQSAYRLHLTSNHVDFGQPLVRFLRRNFNEETMKHPDCGELRAGIRQQVFLRYRFVDREYWEHTEEAPCDGPAKLLWGCHNMWLQYFHTQDAGILADLLPILEGGLNAMRAGMREEDGRLVIPTGKSWEAWTGKNPTGLLCVFKWALHAAIRIGEDLGRDAETLGKWRDWKRRVSDYPVGPEGLHLGEGQPPMSHRHWSHLMMLFPLDTWDTTDEAKRELALQSVDHWAEISAGLDGNPAQAFAPVAAMHLYAWLGKPDRIARLADIFLHTHCTRAPGVWPNTMYREWGPVIETPLFFANALQECVLQTREDGIHVFPAVPKEWPDIVFHKWHAGGDFLVSAERQAGATRWISISSLGGHPQRFFIDLPDGLSEQGLPSEAGQIESDGSLFLSLRAGERLTLANDRDTLPAVHRVEARSGQPNPFGANDRFYRKRTFFQDESQPLVRRSQRRG